MDEQLLDDLALVFAEAAVRGFLAEQAAKQGKREPAASDEQPQATKAPAASQEAQR